MARRKSKVKRSKKKGVVEIRVDLNKDGKVDTIRIYTPKEGRYSKRSKPARVWLGTEPAHIRKKVQEKGKVVFTKEYAGNLVAKIYDVGNEYILRILHGRKIVATATDKDLARLKRKIGAFIAHLRKLIREATK